MTKSIRWHNVFSVLESLLRLGSYGPKVWTSCNIIEENVTIENKTLDKQPVKGKFDVLVLGYETQESNGSSRYYKRVYHPQQNLLLISNHLKDKYLYTFLENLHENITEILNYKKVSEQKVKSYQKIISIIAPNCKYAVCERCGFDYEISRKACPNCSPWTWFDKAKSF